METLIGVKEMHLNPLSKRDFLLVDKVAAVSLRAAFDSVDQPEAVADLEWLVDNGLIMDGGFAFALASYPPVRSEQLGFALAIELVTVALVLDEYATAQSLILPSTEVFIRAGRRLVYEHMVNATAMDLAKRRKTRTVPLLSGSRYDAYEEFSTHVQEFARVLRSLPTEVRNSSFQAPGSHELRKHIETAEFFLDEFSAQLTSQSTTCVLEVVLDHLPVPDDSVAWPDLIEWRSDSRTRYLCLELRRWIRKVADDSLSTAEVREELEYLIASFREHMRVYRLKTTPSVLRTVLTVPADLIAALRGAPLSRNGALFSLAERKAYLLDEEQKAPGHEVAFILAAAERFKRR